MATRRKSHVRGRGASRGQQGVSGWLWLLAGILIGLGLAWYLFGKGYIPQPVGEAAMQQQEPKADTGPLAQELAGKAQPESASTPSASDDTRYLLQVGSFRAMNDADQLKARLALLGIVARVQSVTVNDATWHRVRVGPVTSAREADELRSRLADNGIDSLVMKDQ